MYRLVRNIANLLVAMILVVATGGFTVFQHYCACENEVISSFMTETVCSEENAIEESCCREAPEILDCCVAVSKPEKHQQSCNHSDDCCQNSVSFYKTSEYSSPAKQETKLFTSVLPAVFQQELITELAAEHEQVVYNDTSPPFPAVKLFLKFHQRKDIPELA